MTISIHDRITADVQKYKGSYYGLFEAIWLATRKERRTGKELVADADAYSRLKMVPNYVSDHYKAKEASDRVMPQHVHEKFERGLR